jgi:hypothetical protein
MKKYRPGPKIMSLNELMEQEFVFWGPKIEPRAWFQNWQIHMAMNSIKGGFIRQAVKIEKEVL